MPGSGKHNPYTISISTCALFLVAFLLLVNRTFSEPVEPGPSIELLTSQTKSATASQADTPKTIQFSGYTWEVKSGDNRGPGDNNWSDDSGNVWVDGKGRLHLRITETNGKWYSSEVICRERFGYGRYTFFLESRVDLFDPNIVLGLFIYTDADGDGSIEPDEGDGEIDIEFTRLGDPSANFNSIYAIQPIATDKSNRERFTTTLNGSYSTHFFHWLPGEVLFQSMHGFQTDDPSSNLIVHQKRIAHPTVPQSDAETVRINFWIYKSPPFSSPLEATVSRFEYEPEYPATGCSNWPIFQ